MILSELKKRNLPALKTREEMVEIMQREVYGYLPNISYKMSVSEPTMVEARFDKGNVHYTRAEVTIETENGAHTFPIFRLLHQDGKKRPLIIYNNFHLDGRSQYFPVEELSEYDVDYITFCYKDITSDDGDFTNGIAPLFLPNGQQKDTDCGKIAMWAWCAMRVLDYALTLPSTDPDNVMISGHSRLGKTALFTGMMDTRFKFVLSNMAGCAGDAIAHGGTGIAKLSPDYTGVGKGENITDITNNFPYWFCKNYMKYRAKNYSDEFDQHYIVASICPRYVLVGSASLDHWADQVSQQLCCAAAGEAWEKAGLTGFKGTDKWILPNEASLEGQVGFFMIDSNHFMSRHCWKRAVEFIMLHKD